MKALALVGLAALLSACSVSTLELEPEWRPLERVVEAGAPIDEGQATTVGDTLYVRDLDAWAAEYPPASVERRALLLHEREHARRELADGPLGLAPWLARYLADPGFRWSEEQHGWALELAELVRGHVQVDADRVAQVLADGYRGMVSLDEARRWVVEVLATAAR